MVLELTHKVWMKYILMILTISACAIMLCACDFPFKQYPIERASYWSSEDPKITLEYTKDDQGYWSFSEKLYWNDKMLDISIGMRGNIYTVFPADSDYYSDRLFSGKWKYRQGNLVLIIEEDFLFGGQYSEIVLTPSAD